MKTALKNSPCHGATVCDGLISISYTDGVKVSFPAAVNHRLRNQPEEKIANMVIGHFGISWPDLDEDLSHAGLRAGRFGEA